MRQPLRGSQAATADDDAEARNALWRAIVAATIEVRRDFNLGTVTALGRELHHHSGAPPVPTWKLVEAISLLGIIRLCDTALSEKVELLGKTGPIAITEEGSTRFIWAQQPMRGESSTLGGVPDLVVTLSSDSPHPDNTLRVIEAKCLRTLDTQTIRAEFGKAHDLRVASYFIWSFYSPSERMISGARGLGLDLMPLGFDSNYRSDLIASPELLVSHVSNALAEARKAGRFARALQDASREAQLKLHGS